LKARDGWHVLSEGVSSELMNVYHQEFDEYYAQHVMQVTAKHTITATTDVAVDTPRIDDSRDYEHRGMRSQTEQEQSPNSRISTGPQPTEHIQGNWRLLSRSSRGEVHELNISHLHRGTVLRAHVLLPDPEPIP